MPKVRTPSLVERDRGLLWHPYAPLDGPAPYAVTSASGTRLHLQAADGTNFEVVDAMSSWWSAVHGYRHPELDAALSRQAGQFSHVMFGGLTHQPAVELAERLVDLAPDGLAHVFLADSGSVSVEVALKLAVQYQRATGLPRRTRFLALRGSYHGDTFAAMSVCDPVDGMHAEFPRMVAEQLFLPRPPQARLVNGELLSDPHEVHAWIAVLEDTVHRHREELAAIIVEPVLQGAGGMHIYAPECVRAARRVASEHGLLLILDEIATGFGRTGKLFAAEWAAVTPDIMCVGKALTGGYLTLAAMLCTRAVALAVTDSPLRALLHGPTFMGNPLACAVAVASLQLLESSGWQQQVAALESGLHAALAPAAGLSSVAHVRVLGGVGVIQLNVPVDVAAVTRAAVEHGVWVRPFRDLVYTMPPYVSSAGDVAAIGAGLCTAVARVHG
ncbi:adenosylmethionine-8-amino-7-oxononanoate aminotransferase [Arthrobacter silviterrae]|uniref:Adenosylmethionine-8-amino-7-oxononanoate aminotransferase n=1 Tax=Arthrobacter silviterrae TaxID=2026658 RepID=A0ABX0DG37_9MICC|nr:adenosylmethionine--8-amino-7-oxononanoate transaminase [Arthrobacter silviterrae]MDQ0276012.1 adenosylmethionine-8-amino-7-oxononanoate aminotransferase [Arthrobacter silviterrae]NGN84355.1 adenosylmethionine--8-amino-7-oxononanoate transaminase [Arthrobacter silviterrae]